MVVKMFAKVIPKEDFTEEELIKIVPTGLHYVITEKYYIIGTCLGMITEEVFSTEDISVPFNPHYDRLCNIEWDSKLTKYEHGRAYIQGPSLTFLE